MTYSTPNHLNAVLAGLSEAAYDRQTDAMADEDTSYDHLTDLDFLASDLADEEDEWYAHNLPVEGF